MYWLPQIQRLQLVTLVPFRLITYCALVWKFAVVQCYIYCHFSTPIRNVWTHFCIYSEDEFPDYCGRKRGFSYYVCPVGWRNSMGFGSFCCGICDQTKRSVKTSWQFTNVACTKHDWLFPPDFSGVRIMKRCLIWRSSTLPVIVDPIDFRGVGLDLVHFKDEPGKQSMRRYTG